MDEMNYLKQKKLLLQMSFNLENNGIVVQYKKLLSEKKFKIYFDSLNLEPFEIKVFPKAWAFFAILFSIWVIYLTKIWIVEGTGFLNIPFIGFFALIFIYLFFSKKNSYIKFKAMPEPLLFLKDKPDKRALDAFINTIKIKQKEYLLRIYIPGENNTEIDELERLDRLKSRKSITEEEFNLLKENVIERIKLKGTFFGDTSIN